ncbi:MAG: type II toxin-antitoxin system Phd/YefM family antitoxin [Lacisediminihabitans sp.]
MKIVNIHDAKTHLSRLVEEEFIIAKAGEPVARVTPIGPDAGARRFGFMKGRIRVPDTFDELYSDEIAELFGAN